MKKRDIDFFERYKKLDVFIGDMFSCNNGVSEYINKMEQTSFSLQKKVKTWDSDYKTLKHLRWVRNKIAHETGVGTETFSTKEDIDDVSDFYNRVLNRKDPLSIVNKGLKKGSKKRKSCYGIVLASIILAIILIAVVMFLQK